MRINHPTLNKIFKLIIFLSFIIPSYVFSQPIKQLSSNDVIKEKALSPYPGNCLCPYYKDSAGKNCGKRSAKDKAGGYSPDCDLHKIDDYLKNKKN